MTIPSTPSSPYLRKQRQFPNDDLKELANQTDLAYIDIANKVNSRTVGIYALNNSTITGDRWYFEGTASRQQSIRKTFRFSAAGAFNHGIPNSEITSYPKAFGTYSDGTNYYGAIYASNTPILGQVTFYITPTQIVVLSGAGAPTIATNSGIIVVEWLSRTPESIT
jgi:hypothetical protein